MNIMEGRMALVAYICLILWASVKAHAELVQFDITLTWEDYEIAGATRKMILTDGGFPGPTLRMKQGDDVEFLVKNHLPFATTVHFHGIEQRGTAWSDGVPGLSQRPIAAGAEFLYKWTATQYGSYFYHAHSRGHIEDGLYGAIYIQPDDSTQRPFDSMTKDSEELGAIYEAEKNTQPYFLADWRLLTSEQVWKAEETTGMNALCANAILINGKGSVQCLPRDVIDDLTTVQQKAFLGNQTLTDMACMPPTNVLDGAFPRNPSAAPKGFYKGCTPSEGPTEVLEVDPNARYVSLDLISAAGVSSLVFSIDEHSMYVYAIDGRYIQPMRVDAVNIPIASRYSVLVKLDRPAGDYTMRVANNEPNQIINGTAVMTYTAPEKYQKDPSQPSIDITGNATRADIVILNENSVVPFPVDVPSSEVDRTYILKVDRSNASYLWKLGNSSFPLADEKATPLLFDRTSIPADLTISTLNGTWVDIILSMTGNYEPPHPIHKHSSKFYVIGSGMGLFNYPTVKEAMKYIPSQFNLQTPQIRDTYTTPPTSTSPSWLALRYHVVNPGPFLLHCHIQVHHSGGMALAILDGVDAWPEVPEGYQ